MDGPAFVRPAGNGPKGETGTTGKNQKTGGFLRPEGALIPPPQDAAQHRMGVEVHNECSLYEWEIAMKINNGNGLPLAGFFEMKQEVYEIRYMLRMGAVK